MIMTARPPRSACLLRLAFLSALLAAAGTVHGLDPGAPPPRPVEVKSVTGDWNALSEVAEDESLALRAVPEKVEEARKRWGYFKALTEKLRAEYVSRGFAPMPKWHIGIVADTPEASRAETPNSEITYVNGNVLAEPEADLTSTLTHEAFHIVQYNSNKAMESTNEAFTRWADESTATWMQYTLGPDSTVIRQRMADFWVPDFDHHYFSWQSVHHPYSCFNFWIFLDELYGAEDIIRQIYTKPVPGQNPPKKVPDFTDALDHILKKRADRKGRVRPLSEVFVEYLIRYYFLKDGEPFKSILAGDGKDGRRDRLLAQLGRPREILAMPGTRLHAEIPFGEGPDRQRKKTFDVFRSYPYGIAQQYDIKSSARDGEKGTLRISTKSPEGSAALLVFPCSGTALQDPVIGSEARPVLLENWEKLDGALVLLVDVKGDQQHDHQVTVQLKAPERWTITVKENPVTSISALSFQSIQVEPMKPLAEEESKKLQGKWFPVGMEIDGRLYHTWGQFYNSVGYIFPVYLPVKQGVHTWRIMPVIGDEAPSLDGASTIKIPAENLATAMKSEAELEARIAELEKKFQDPAEREKDRIRTDIGATHASLASALCFRGEFALAKRHAELGIEQARGQKPEVFAPLAQLFLATGDVERYLTACESGGRNAVIKKEGEDNVIPYLGSLHYHYAAMAAVNFHNDLAGAAKYHDLHVEKLKACGEPRPPYKTFPSSADEVLK